MEPVSLHKQKQQVLAIDTVWKAEGTAMIPKQWHNFSVSVTVCLWLHT